MLSLNEAVTRLTTGLNDDLPGALSEEDVLAQFDLANTDKTPREVFMRELPKDADRFVITAAQNSTPLDEYMWPVLRNFCDVEDAELLVVPFLYKNLTSVWTMSQRNAFVWAEKTRPYLWNQRLNLNKNLTLMADIPIQPTSGNPLARTDSMSGVNSGIFGHAKLQMKTIATPGKRMAKIMTTTGACTVQNYTTTAIGKIGEFHHSLCALYVEIDGDEFHLTQLHYDKRTRGIIDRGKRYFANRVGPAPRALAIVGGDEHVKFQDPAVIAARLELIKQTDPRCRMFHDTLDAYSCSPHHQIHPFLESLKNADGHGNVREEAAEAVAYVERYASKRCPAIVVPSNHDNMLYRWLERVEQTGAAKLSKNNKEFYYELASKVSRGSFTDDKGLPHIPDPFGILLRERNNKHIRVLDIDEDYVLADVLMSMHGDLGPNGARGSRMNLRRIGVKSIIGHSHAPGIEEGCTQTGTSTYLRLEYNHGANGWLNADVLLNADGKRQVIIYVNGRFRAGEKA